MEPCIKVENVSMMFNLSRNREERLKEYIINFFKGKLFFDEFWALKNVSFEVEKGDSLGIIGVNGAGKSTLLKIVSGILSPTSGRVIVNGSISPLIEMGGGFDSSLSARENIYLVGAMHGHTKEFMRRRFDQIIDFAELQDFVDVPIRNYSSGMHSRLAFAIATLVRADILIADEVLAVGDMKFRQKAQQRITELMDKGTTVLFVSHSPEQLKKVCKKSIWLKNGEIAMYDDTAVVCDAYKKFVDGAN